MGYVFSTKKASKKVRKIYGINPICDDNFAPNDDQQVDFQYHIFLVGGIPTLLKNMSSSVGMVIPNIWKTCSKPPTSYP